MAGRERQALDCTKRTMRGARPQAAWEGSRRSPWQMRSTRSMKSMPPSGAIIARLESLTDLKVGLSKTRQTRKVLSSRRRRGA